MQVVKVRGLKEYTVNGKEYRYHRKSGVAIDVKVAGHALVLEVERLDKLHAAPVAKAGTLGSLLESWKRSPSFTGLKPRTRADYQKIMDYLRPIAGTPLVELTTGIIAKLRDKTAGKKHGGFTNHMLAMLSSAFRHGLEYELVDKNPVTGLGKAKISDDRKKPNRPWTPDERRNVPAAAWAQLRLPILLARTWGIRRGDIVAMSRSAYVGGWLTFRAGKNNKLLTLPVLGELRREMDAAMAIAPKGNSTNLCLNTRGKPWTPNGLSVQLDKFFDECRERGIMGPGGSLHGLRHSLGAELRRAGYTAEQRKMVLGHDTDEMAEHYAASADVRGELIDMANVLEAGPKRERLLSKRTKRHV
jgi:integrase